MSEYLDSILAYGLTWFGKVQFQTKPPKIRACHCRQAIEEGNVGDIICRRYDGYLDGKFIPGEYSHSGVIESKFIDIGQPGTVIHAVAEGVERIDILDFVKDSDGIAILRFEGVEWQAVRDKARSLIGTPYDFKFSVMDGGQALYCHETSAVCLSAEWFDVIPIKIVPEVKMGREIITYNSLLSHHRCNLVYEAKV